MRKVVEQGIEVEMNQVRGRKMRVEGFAFYVRFCILGDLYLERSGQVRGELLLLTRREFVGKGLYSVLYSVIMNMLMCDRTRLCVFGCWVFVY
jgi:hypothetical protein